MTFTDLSSLPRAEKKGAGEPPDTNPRFISVLVDKWATANALTGSKATAHNTMFRHSDAGKCARMLGYKAAHIPESNQMDLAGTWVTSLGTLLHEKWQEALQENFPDAEIEFKVMSDGADSSGHIDAVIRIPQEDGSMFVICYELKTVGGFSYKLKVGDRGEPQGPDYTHKLQCALNGKAVDADLIVIGYLATEAISKGQAAKKKISELTRFAAEWAYTREEYMPWAEKELERLALIEKIVAGGELPKRVIPSPELPPGVEIVDPSTGRWEEHGEDDAIIDTGTFWSCNYCPYQDVCVTTKPGRIPIADVVRGAA